MTNQEYLRSLLKTQDLTEPELSVLRNLRDTIEQQLRSGLLRVERVYYAGSYAKKTMIREQYDLDIVIYWGNDCGYTLKDIYNAVGNVLRKNWKLVNPKTVAFELPFQGGFHIDVVPGRAIDNSFKYANLYRSDKDSSLQTSIKVHIDTVRNSGRSDVIRLMKLWRKRKSVPFKKSLALELITIDGCVGKATIDLEGQLLAAFRHIRDNIMTIRLVDPANTNNILSEEISIIDKLFNSERREGGQRRPILVASILTMTYKKKLIEVALPLEAINKASAREKSIRHGHPSTLHLWWARRPLAAARAVIFAQMVDDPSAHPDIFKTEKAQEKERQRLFKIIEDLVQWENTTNEEVLQRRVTRSGRAGARPARRTRIIRAPKNYSIGINFPRFTIRLLVVDHCHSKRSGLGWKLTPAI